ncbi:MAG: hypothetical protein AB1714_00250 [Acidobacteriota bacterium]
MTRSMRDRRHERGGVRFGPLVMIIIILVGGYAAFKIVPARMDYYEFRDAVAEQAKHASGRAIDIPGMRGTLMNRARELDLPIKEEQIEISWTPEFISIHVQYSVDANLFGYVYTQRFDIDQRNRIFG